MQLNCGTQIQQAIDEGLVEEIEPIYAGNGIDILNFRPVVADAVLTQEQEVEEYASDTGG